MRASLEQVPSVHASDGDDEKRPAILAEETSSAVDDKRLLRRIDVWSVECPTPKSVPSNSDSGCVP